MMQIVCGSKLVLLQGFVGICGKTFTIVPFTLQPKVHKSCLYSSLLHMYVGTT